MIEENAVPSGHPQTKQPTPSDVPIGFDYGESPLEALPQEISPVGELSKRGDLAKTK